MIRFFVSATYRTAGGNLGQAAFQLVAPDHWETVQQLAKRRLSIRGRSRFHITVTREA
jgi:hypothetical protein